MSYHSIHIHICYTLICNTLMSIVYRFRYLYSSNNKYSINSHKSGKYGNISRFMGVYSLLKKEINIIPAWINGTKK